MRTITIDETGERMEIVNISSMVDDCRWYYVRTLPKPEKTIVQEVVAQHGSYDESFFRADYKVTAILCDILDRKFRELREEIKKANGEGFDRTHQADGGHGF